MKTSLFISSIAALFLLVTFAEAPHRHGGDKMEAAAADNITFATVRNVTLLPGVIISPDRKKEAGISSPVPVEDFGYLEFDVTKYMEDEAFNPDQLEILPGPSESDYSYLKFSINEYVTESEITELPVNEQNTEIIGYELLANDLEYLRFNVNEYISQSGPEGFELRELPFEESNSNSKHEIIEEDNNTNEFGYLKFDATKYYGLPNLGSDGSFELPEK